jgi:hypothetical protein
MLNTPAHAQVMRSIPLVVAQCLYFVRVDRLTNIALLSLLMTIVKAAVALAGHVLLLHTQAVADDRAHDQRSAKHSLAIQDRQLAPGVSGSDLTEALLQRSAGDEGLRA